jgi:hypothetical protein
MIEHWDIAQHTGQLVNGGHDDAKHQAQIRLFISAFSLLRLLVFTTQIVRNSEAKELKDYLKTNWLDMVVPLHEEIEDLQSDESASETIREEQIDAVKMYVKRCSAWNA